MSDTEGAPKKSGYRLEYASSARAKCKGSKPCTGENVSNPTKSSYTGLVGTPIPKGALRVGSIVDFRGNTNFAWRHWGCTTPRIIANMKAKFANPDDLDGFESLQDEDKERVRSAWEQGHVADEDIPPTARKQAEAGEDDEEKSRKKRAPAKKKAETEGDEEEKPKKKRATKPKKTEDEAEDEDAEEDAEVKTKSAPIKKSRAKKRDGEEEAEKPKGATRRQSGAKRAPMKKKVVKDESEVSGEDFADELAEVEDEDDDDVDESANKKRKRPASKQAATKKQKAASSRAKRSKAVVEEDEDDE